jgi:TPR repeat protein
MNLDLGDHVGRGVAQQLDCARTWIQKAADQGEPGVAEKLAQLLVDPKLVGVQH